MSHGPRGDGRRLSTFVAVAEVRGIRPAGLRLHMHSRPESGAVLWRINGFRARLLVWTEDEWERLDSRPTDAQFHPSGIWCALRLE
jgi:hypothetical protein